MAEVDLLIVGYAATALALKVEQRGAVFVGGVGYQLGLRRIENLDFGLQLSEEQSFRREGSHVVRVALRRGDKEIASASTTVKVRRDR